MSEVTAIRPAATSGSTDAAGRSRPPTTAFVLGGGGNLGAVQVGMLRALFEHGIRPDLLLGCSAGALNAAAIAEDPSLDGVRHLERTWAGLRGETVFPSPRFISPWLLFRKGSSVCTNRGLRDLIEHSLGIRTFEEAVVPFEVVATRMSTGHAHWFDTGDIVGPILASAAIPAVLPPVSIDGELHIDGGVVENVPIDRARQRGCDRIVVLHVGNFERPRPRPQRPIDVLLQSFSIARNYDFLRESSRLVGGIEVIVLPAIDPGPLKRHDFSRGRDLMARATEAASRHLEQLSPVSPHAYSA